MIVADANLTVYLYVEGTQTREARDVLQHDAEWIVPPLWRSEFLNVMWQYIRTGTFTVEDALRRYQAARNVIRVEAEPPSEFVLQLAADHKLTAYDATYAALGQYLEIPHVTYDKEVISAGFGIHPSDFLNP